MLLQLTPKFSIFDCPFAFKIRAFRFQASDKKAGIKKTLSIFIPFSRNFFSPHNRGIKFTRLYFSFQLARTNFMHITNPLIKNGKAGRWLFPHIKFKAGVYFQRTLQQLLYLVYFTWQSSLMKPIVNIKRRFSNKIVNVKKLEKAQPGIFHDRWDFWEKGHLQFNIILPSTHWRKSQQGNILEFFSPRCS